MKKQILVVVAAIVGLAAPSVSAQGTIQFLNSALSRLRYTEIPGTTPVDMPVGTVVGVFWGRTADALTLAENTVTMTSPGLFSGGTVYALPGTNPGESVFLKVAAWWNQGGVTPRAALEGPCSAGITHYGESSVVEALLGPTAGPGTVIWQSSTGINPNRAKPFNFVICPEPSTWALLGVGLGALLFRCRKPQP